MLKLYIVAHSCNPKMGRLRQEESEFKATPGYFSLFCGSFLSFSSSSFFNGQDYVSLAGLSVSHQHWASICLVKVLKKMSSRRNK